MATEKNAKYCGGSKLMHTTVTTNTSQQTQFDTNTQVIHLQYLHTWSLTFGTYRLKISVLTKYCSTDCSLEWVLQNTLIVPMIHQPHAWINNNNLNYLEYHTTFSDCPVSATWHSKVWTLEHVNAKIKFFVDFFQLVFTQPNHPEQKMKKIQLISTLQVNCALTKPKKRNEASQAFRMVTPVTWKLYQPHVMSIIQPIWLLVA